MLQWYPSFRSPYIKAYSKSGHSKSGYRVSGYRSRMFMLWYPDFFVRISKHCLKPDFFVWTSKLYFEIRICCPDIRAVRILRHLVSESPFSLLQNQDLRKPGYYCTTSGWLLVFFSSCCCSCYYFCCCCWCFIIKSRMKSSTNSK